MADVAASEAGDLLASEEAEAFEIVGGDLAPGILVVCDHAKNTVPSELGTLGLAPDQLERHIAYDIGAEGVTRAIACHLGVPAVMSRFSRLLIDPNRGEDDPTLVMQLSDGAVVPGNKALTESDLRSRLDRFYHPYDTAVGRCIDEFERLGIPPIILSIHSFTPAWKGVLRPWHIALLWDDDPRLSKPMLAELRRDTDLCVGENEPYSGQLRGDTMNRHATARGLAHSLIEVRQDEISDDDGQRAWGLRIAQALSAVIAHDELTKELRTPRTSIDEMVAAQL